MWRHRHADLNDLVQFAAITLRSKKTRHSVTLINFINLVQPRVPWSCQCRFINFADRVFHSFINCLTEIPLQACWSWRKTESNLRKNHSLSSWINLCEFYKCVTKRLTFKSFSLKLFLFSPLERGLIIWIPVNGGKKFSPIDIWSWLWLPDIHLTYYNINKNLYSLWSDPNPQF